MVRDYVVALWRHWRVLLTGVGALVILTFFASAGESPWLALVWVAGATVLAAQFLVWRSEHRERNREVSQRVDREDRERRLLEDRVLRNETFRPLDLLRNHWDVAAVETREFEDCTITGPAVISFQVSTDMDRCSFSVPAVTFREVPKGYATAGVVHFVNCRFLRCKFGPTVEIMGDKDLIDKLRSIPNPRGY